AAAPQRAVSGGDGNVRSAGAATIAPPRMPEPVTPKAPVFVHKGPPPATPAVRRYAREQNVDLRTVPGSGPGGRVLPEDVDRFRSGGATAEMEPGIAVQEAPAAPPARTAETPGREVVPMVRPPSAAAAEGMPDFSQWGAIKREPAPQIRKAIARQMLRA